MGKHGVIIADLHCGHRFGLTPPQKLEQEGGDHKQEKIRIWQVNTWNWYAAKAKEIGHIDRLIINGDACEGDGVRSGATELYTSDRDEQVQIAEFCARQFDFDKATVIEGTASHTGTAEAYEAILARELGTHLQQHAWLEYAGCVIDFKHHIGTSSTPGAVPPALPREAVWNMMWGEHELQPRATVFIRSHGHGYFVVIEDDFTAIITPSLQGFTKYGGTRMSKTITYGLIEWWISDEGVFTWKRHRLIPTFAAAKAEAI